MESITKTSVVDEQIDKLYVAMSELPQVECPLKHIFTKGMYIREIFMPKGTVIISKQHKTNHPYIVSMGKVAVYNSEDDFSGIIEAPFTGVTMPGTRRILNILEDTIWTTFHALPHITGEEDNWTDEEKHNFALEIEDMIIEKRIIELENKEVLQCHS